MESKRISVLDAFDVFMKKDWSDYAGQWVAICDKKIISSNKDLKKVLKESSKKCKGNTPTFTKIPDKDTALLL